MRLVIDTSAYSHFKRGSTSAVDAISRATWIGMPVVVLAELGLGFRLGKKRAQNERELDAFLRHPLVDVLAVDEAVATVWSELVVTLRAAGTPLPTNDVWIAATAVNAGAPVLTYDAHFDRVARVGVVRL